MKKTIMAVVAYDGTNYQGFQRQKDYGVGVQQVLEKALSTALHEDISIKAAGRTDAGVHALGQVISFETSSPIPPENYRRALQHLLPPDIAIREAFIKPDGFHARFDALDKTYRYTVLYAPLPDPCARRYAWEVRSSLTLAAMNEAAALLVGTHDFSSFKNQGSEKTSPVRTLYEAYWTQEKERFTFTIRGDGFLYRMVRNIFLLLTEETLDFLDALGIGGGDHLRHFDDPVTLQLAVHVVIVQPPQIV